MGNKSSTKLARVFLAGNLGYLESLISQYGPNMSIQEIYNKEKEKHK